MRAKGNRLKADLDHVLEHTEALWLPLRGARFFLTGGTGFVGTWLTESLLWANQRLKLGLTAALMTRDAARFTARSPHLANDPAVRLIVADSANEWPSMKADFVVHAATSNYAGTEGRELVSVFDHDVSAMRCALEFARLTPGCRLLFTSSGAVYGKQPPALLRIPESFVGAPLTTDLPSTCGHAKRVAEHLCATYSKAYGFDAMIARLFAFIGPYLPLDADNAAGNFLREAMRGGPIRIPGDGTPYRSYLYAADLAIWLWTILFRGESCAPYNVGSNEPLTIYELARAVERAAAPGAMIEIAERARPGQPTSRYVPCTRRAEEALGLKAWIPLEEAIRRSCDWHAAELPALAGCA